MFLELARLASAKLIVLVQVEPALRLIVPISLLATEYPRYTEYSVARQDKMTGGLDPHNTCTCNYHVALLVVGGKVRSSSLAL